MVVAQDDEGRKMNREETGQPDKNTTAEGTAAQGRTKTRKKASNVELEPPPHLVESLCKCMSRLAAGRRLYAPDNKLLVQMSDRLEEAWRLLKVRGKNVPLNVTIEGLKYHDIVVFHEEDREAFSTRLFKDGLRRLVFLPDATTQDLVDFLSIFDLDLEQWGEEADCADKLWVLDQRCIRFEAVDGFDDLIKQTRGEAQEDYAAALAQISGDAGAFERLNDDPEQGTTAEERALQAWGQTRRADVTLKSMRFLSQEVDDQKLDAPEQFWDADLGKPSQTFMQFHELLRYVMASERCPIPVTSLQEMMRRLFHEQLLHDDEGMVARIESCFQEPEPMGSIARNAWKEAAQGDLLARLVAEAHEETGRQNALTTLLNRYVAPNPEALVESMLRTHLVEGCRPLLDMLYKLPGNHLSLWEPHIEELRPALMREVLERTPTSQLEEEAGHIFLDHLGRSAETERIVVSMELAPRSYLEARKELFLTRLGDQERNIRLGALEGLRRLGDPSVGIHILGRLRRVQEFKAEPSEIQALLLTLMEIGGERYVPFLEQCLGPLDKRSQGAFKGSFRHTYVNPLGDFAVLQALVRHGSPKALELVKRVYQHPNAGDLRSYIGALRIDPSAQPEQIDEIKARALAQSGMMPSSGAGLARKPASTTSSTSRNAARRSARPSEEATGEKEKGSVWNSLSGMLKRK